MWLHMHGDTYIDVYVGCMQMQWLACMYRHLHQMFTVAGTEIQTLQGHYMLMK